MLNQEEGGHRDATQQEGRVETSSGEPELTILLPYKPAVDDSISFERFVAELEDPLSAIHLDIKTTRDQETGEAYVSLVSSSALHDQSHND